jgi:hypothetical protein
MEKNPIQKQIDLFLETKQMEENCILLEHELIQEITKTFLPLFQFITEEVKVYSHTKAILNSSDEFRYEELVVLRTKWTTRDSIPSLKYPFIGTISEGYMLAINANGTLLKGIYKELNDGLGVGSEKMRELYLSPMSIAEFADEIKGEDVLRIISQKIYSKLPSMMENLETTKKEVEKLTKVLEILTE